MIILFLILGAIMLIYTNKRVLEADCPIDTDFKSLERVYYYHHQRND